MKVCFKCNKEKDITEFYAHPGTKDKTLNKCQECTKADVSKHRATNMDKVRQYDRYRSKYSIKRILAHKYRGIISRSTEVFRGRKAGSYGKPYLTPEQWEDWTSKTHDSFIALYDNWKVNNFTQRLAPSVDRIDNYVGYVPENMRWITQSENCSKGNRKIKTTTLGV